MLSQTCDADSPGAELRSVVVDGQAIKYFYRPLSSLPLSERESRTSSYNHVPVVVDSSGRPWSHAVIQLIDIIEEAGLPANGIDNAQPVATDLADFKRFLELASLDYLSIPDNKRKRPPYRYRAHLMAQINAGALQRSVARRRMANVIGFYRNLKSHKILPSDLEIWDENDVYIETEARDGTRYRRSVRTTDLSISAPTKQPAISDHIVDGGKLRPLPAEEQIALLDEVVGSRNTEMILIVLILMIAAARIQTVLTLRARDFLDEKFAELLDVRIPAGPGTGVDTKANQKKVLHIPGSLYRLVQIYAMSDRAAKRRKKAGQSLDEAYLFLTNRGRPYFESRFDRSTYDPNTESGQANRGAAVQSFFRRQLLPKLRLKFGESFTLRPHDLKATGGLNKWEQLMELVALKRINLNQARDRLREFLWHSNFEVTDRYVNFKSNKEMFFDIQSRYETHLVALIETAINDGWSEDEETSRRSRRSGR
ncbi:hypothetical protein AB4Y35_18380 [Paraburkholderia sp. EG286A]|uniref:hypothetical protein n=1 Tax=Paraburkholderia sp. EG286A TaxID=3237014 RepID=UPI0034D283A1